jgi:hypothetical protein
MKSTVKLGDIPLTAIAKIVDYLEVDEEKDYDFKGGRNHIVHSVHRLKKFLYAIDPDNNPLERMYIKWAKRMDREQERNMRKVWGGVVADNNREQNRDRE